jgi:hypothetical protein
MGSKRHGVIALHTGKQPPSAFEVASTSCSLYLCRVEQASPQTQHCCEFACERHCKSRLDRSSHRRRPIFGASPYSSRLGLPESSVRSNGGFHGAIEEDDEVVCFPFHIGDVLFGIIVLSRHLPRHNIAVSLLVSGIVRVNDMEL